MLPSEAPCISGDIACTPSNSSLDSRQPASELRPPKSAKRRAAEALLHRRYSSSTLAPDGGGGGAKRQRTDQQRPPVRVAACSDCAACSADCVGGSSTAAAWCSQDVALPPMDWPAALQSVSLERDVVVDQRTQCYHLPGGLRVHVVAAEGQLPAALAALRRSMQDSCVAIDLEWKPEGWAGGGPTRVALMQLASATVAVLVRVCRLGFRMPPSLRAFLSDPDLTFIGFSWDSSDEVKMRQTFGEGRRELFPRFLDLQQVGASLGYHGFGLAALTKRVLGFALPKCRKVTMSNWEARQLSARQVQYGALDAVVTGHIFRGLRLWHASPSACTACRQMLGAVLPQPAWHCHDCSRDFSTSGALQSHRAQKRHRVSPAVCDECGRVHAQRAPEGSSAGALALL